MRALEVVFGLAIAGALVACVWTLVQRHIVEVHGDEARRHLEEIAEDLAMAYEGEVLAVAPDGDAGVVRHACATSTFVPASLEDVKGHSYQSNRGEWELPKDRRAGWPCLQFAIDGPQWHRYHYEADGGGTPGTTMAITAEGDLDGNGVTSIARLNAGVNAQGFVTIAPSIEETRPYE